MTLRVQKGASYEGNEKMEWKKRESVARSQRKRRWDGWYSLTGDEAGIQETFEKAEKKTRRSYEKDGARRPVWRTETLNVVLSVRSC